MIAAVNKEERIASYRAIRDRYLVCRDRENAAFTKWFNRRLEGKPTNAGRATALANLTNYASADLASAEDLLYALDIDPRDIDKQDGVPNANGALL